MTDNEKVSDTPVSKDDSALESGKETLRMIFLALVIALVVRTFAFEPFNIPSSSMVPSLLVGDFLFVSKYSYGYGARGTFWGVIPLSGRLGGGEPKRGDVVVFKLPRDPSIDYIKRVIGLPGDTVQMRQGILYINGLPVERSRIEAAINPDDDPDESRNITEYMEYLPQGAAHVIRKVNGTQALDNTEVFTVPPGQYFFMGDNRDNSQDSRTKNVGLVPIENLVGRAEILFFSIEGDVRFWQIWKWPFAVRWSRLLKRVE